MIREERDGDPAPSPEAVGEIKLEKVSITISVAESTDGDDGDGIGALRVQENKSSDKRPVLQNDLGNPRPESGEVSDGLVQPPVPLSSIKVERWHPHSSSTLKA